MVLLTSSQVSVALSSAIVILFTTALFFSGYAIQQRTLRDLRRAIRPDPRPSPKIYLPDRFKQSTTELPDGRVVGIDDGGAAHGNDDGSQAQSSSASQGDFVVKVRPSVAGYEDGAAQKPVVAAGGEGDSAAAAAVAAPGGDKSSAQQAGEVAQKGGDVGGQGKGKVEAEKEKPISSAERRRRIKEEIRQLSQGETPIYYQRRLW